MQSQASVCQHHSTKLRIPFDLQYMIVAGTDKIFLSHLDVTLQKQSKLCTVQTT